MAESLRLMSAYASLAEPNGAALYASPEGLRTLASFLREGSALEIELAPPPDKVVEAGPIETIRLLPGNGPVLLRTTEDVIEIAGGSEAFSTLAATLENLADTDDGEAEAVARHVDLEYFPGDKLLDASSSWMTIFRVDPE